MFYPNIPMLGSKKDKKAKEMIGTCLNLIKNFYFFVDTYSESTSDTISPWRDIIAT